MCCPRSAPPWGGPVELSFFAPVGNHVPYCQVADGDPLGWVMIAILAICLLLLRYQLKRRMPRRR